MLQSQTHTAADMLFVLIDFFLLELHIWNLLHPRVFFLVVYISSFFLFYCLVVFHYSMAVQQFCSPRGDHLVVSHPACLLSDKHRLYSEIGLHKICCMVKARLACPSGQDLGITASWLREDRVGARAAFSLPREFAGLSQGGDRQVPAAASAGGHGCTGESAPPTSYIWPWALPPTWLCHIWPLECPLQETCLDCPHLHWSHPMYY